jgi:hypothetical protein
MRIAAVSLTGLLLCGFAAVEAFTRSASGPPAFRPEAIRGEVLETGKARPPSTEGQEPQEPDEEKPAVETVKVTGTVVDRDGNPVTQAQVSLSGPKSGSAWTDGDGAFQFEGPPGDYRARSRPGASPRALLL